MTEAALEGALRRGGALVAAGLVMQLASFLWNHPLAFIAFAVVGGGLVAGGMFVFLAASVKARTWKDPVGTSHRGSAGQH